MQTRVSLTVVLSRLLLLPTASSLAAEFSGVGVIDPYQESRVVALSDDGLTVAGTQSRRVLQPKVHSWTEAFVWTPDTSVKLLGVPGGQESSFAANVSGNGQLVIGSTGDGRSPHPFIWSEPSGFQASETFSEITPDGSYLAGNGAPEARRYSTATGVLTFLHGPVGWQLYDTHVGGISADGQVVVGSAAVVAGGYQAFRWDQKSGMVPLPFLQEPHPVNSFAVDVSADGTTTVGREGDFGVPSERGVLWDGFGDPHEIVPPLGFDAVFPAAISGDGRTVVGTAFKSDGSSEPVDRQSFVWTAQSGSFTLNQIMAENPDLLDSARGWLLYEATDVSADGRVLIGNGTNPLGHTEGWRLRLDRPVPEPPTITLLFSGLAGLAALGWFRLRP